jgi:hypothetical protein
VALNRYTTSQSAESASNRIAAWSGKLVAGGWAKVARAAFVVVFRPLLWFFVVVGSRGAGGDGDDGRSIIELMMRRWRRRTVEESMILIDVLVISD